MKYRKSVVCFFLICAVVGGLLPEVCFSDNSGYKFFKAEACYNSLLKDRSAKAYRHNWLKCIKKFDQAFREDPTGKFASASLYMYGRLYGELYKWSNRSSDRKEAEDAYQRIIKRFSKSLYSSKAKKAIQSFSAPVEDPKLKKKQALKPDKSKPDRPVSDRAGDEFFKAEACYNMLIKDKSAKKYRHNWMRCIKKFDQTFREDPTGKWAAASLYMYGSVYQELYKWSGKSSDRKEAEDTYQRIIKLFPKSLYTVRAKESFEKLSGPVVSKKAERKKSSELNKKQESKTDKAKNQFFQAENCYNSLVKNTSAKKYRDNWIKCINKFQAAFKQDPSGVWASASLYRYAKAYQELYKWSGSSLDKKESQETYKKIISSFPESRYSFESQKALKNFSEPTVSPKPEKEQASKKKNQGDSKQDKAKNKFFKAQGGYASFLKDNPAKKYRINWIKCINMFEAAFRQDTSGPWAPASLYMYAGAYAKLYRWSNRSFDKNEALETYRQIIKNFSESQYSIRAKEALGNFPEQPATTAPENRQNRNKSEKQTRKSQHSGTKALVKELKHWSNPNYTRVVINTDREVNFNHTLLRKDTRTNKPQRLYIDLKNSMLGPNLQRSVPINDHLLKDARAAQFSRDTVRVVVDIKSFKTYKVFSLKDPFRIVIDVSGHASNLVKQKPDQIQAGAIAKQLALGVRRIVIDPGHGGKDFGAPGYIKNVHEKDIVLRIAKRLAIKIKEQLGCEVILTRTSDRFLTLEERTAFANTKNADLFISIHTNSSRIRTAHGIETFFLNLATDDEAIRVAARENATSTKNISDLQMILNDLMKNAKISESSRLAHQVQTAMCSALKKSYAMIKDNGVKQAPFYVLLGAHMPSILIEASFISHYQECKRLINPTYQNRVCDAIVAGVKNYIKENNPSAFD
jgi:N-acetylmuramoyl-L-alanine amidase